MYDYHQSCDALSSRLTMILFLFIFNSLQLHPSHIPSAAVISDRIICNMIGSVDQQTTNFLSFFLSIELDELYVALLNSSL